MNLHLLLSVTLLWLLSATVACGGVPSAPAPQTTWVRDRLDAYAKLYSITPEGRGMLAALDVRHMVGKPAWAGSTGFDGFAGIGQANAATIAHEIGHSYWGAFPVTGQPGLSWDAPPGQGESTALAQYHADLRAFMRQPPDRYELLRERFRNLPNLNKGSYPDLYHMGEADMVSLAAGDLDLVPPVLRKYFDHYLAPGQPSGWEELFRWYLGLSEEDRRLADEYLALAHVPKDDYSGLAPSPSAALSEEVKEILRGEERQRLTDFAAQFDQILESDDSLVDAVGVDTGFPFWRSYLREMYRLDLSYPGLLAEAEQAKTSNLIAPAFAILREAEGLGGQDKVQFLEAKLEEYPFLYNFLPILENRVLLGLLGTEEGTVRPEAAQKGTGAFVEELRRFVGDVDRILRIGRASPEEGARALEEYLDSLKGPDEHKLEQDVDTLFELFTDSDRATTEAVMARVKDATIGELLSINPARTRFLLSPERLLDAIDLRAGAPRDDFREGLEELLDYSSGNFEIDRPFTQEAYRRIAERGRGLPRETLEIIKEAQLPMPGFLLGYPADAIGILSSDLPTTLDLVAGSGPVRVPPVRLIYHMIYVDPEFAAAVVEGLSQRGDSDLTSEALIYFAYDYARLGANPDLKVSLDGDARFLTGLLERKGEGWFTEQVALAVKRYRLAVEEGTVDPDFLDAYRRTLRAASATLEQPGERAALDRAISSAFSRAGLEF